MKRQTYYFTVGKEVYKVIAESSGHAMQWMNRQVMDKLNIGPFAWMDDGAKKNCYYAAGGNYWD